MANGIWPAVSGAEAQSAAVDIISNNLANVDTLGFKKDQPAFREYLAIEERDHGVPDIPRGPITDKEFHRLEGDDQSFVIVDGTYTNFKPGHLKVTKRPLDVALEGPGFFEVSTPNGVRYTKHGSFKLAKDGQLVTSQGYPVLAAQPGGLATALPASAVQSSQGGQSTQGGVAAGQGTPQPPPPEVVARYINLNSQGESIAVNPKGEIYMDGNKVADLGIAYFQDTGKLRKEHSQLFANPDPQNQIADGRSKVMQGMIETSNVNPVEEMANLIKSNRLFQQNLKAIKTYDSLMDKESNTIGVVR